jgi:5'-AMP-activated protein kinase regulatory gamma subunit
MAPTRDEMVSITPEETLYDACKALRDHRLHRVPVIDPSQNSVLAVLTHSGILEYLVSTFREQRRLFDQPIFDLGIGVYSGFVTVPEDMSLIRVLHTLVERRVSAVPIVDASGGSPSLSSRCPPLTRRLTVGVVLVPQELL